MVGYMSGSKKARSTPSITNNTKIFGLMGGLAPRVGTSDVAVYRHKIIKGGRGLPELNGKTPEQQQYYMKVNRLLSINPAGSGGVGKKSNLYHFSCNCTRDVPAYSFSNSINNSTQNSFNPIDTTVDGPGAGWDVDSSEQGGYGQSSDVHGPDEEDL
jgi:hypothetical protein